MVIYNIKCHCIQFDYNLPSSFRVTRVQRNRRTKIINNKIFLIFMSIAKYILIIIYMNYSIQTLILLQFYYMYKQFLFKHCNAVAIDADRWTSSSKTSSNSFTTRSRLLMRKMYVIIMLLSLEPFIYTTKSSEIIRENTLIYIIVIQQHASSIYSFIILYGCTAKSRVSTSRTV